MSTGTYYVAAGADDWMDNPLNSTSTVMQASYVNILFPPMTVVRQAFADIDTSGIPDSATLLNATLYWYSNAYTATKGTSKIYDVSIWDGSIWRRIASNKTFALGWQSSAVGAAFLQYISLAAKTSFKWSCRDPGTGKQRVYGIRTYEHVPSPDSRAYLEVEYSAGPRIFGVILG